MRMLRGLLIALLTAFGGGVLAVSVGDYLIRLAHVPQMEGQRGMTLFFLCVPPGLTLTSSLPWNRANFTLFYDGPADTWVQGLDVGAVVHWTGPYEDDNFTLTGSPKVNMPKNWRPRR